MTPLERQLSSERYGTIVADPPWHYGDMTDPWRSTVSARERLEQKLTAMLNRQVAKRRAEQPERIALNDTMAGWQ